MASLCPVISGSASLPIPRNLPPAQAEVANRHGCSCRRPITLRAERGLRVLLVRQKEAVQEKLTSLALQMSQTSRAPKGQEALVAERAVREQAPLAAPFWKRSNPR